MATFLCKTEPGEYSYDDLVRDKQEPWDGVRNAAAQSHMRAMKKGDEVWIYHSQTDKAIVGLGKVVKGPYPDPDVPGTTAKGDPKGVLVDLGPKTKLDTPVTLADLKADGRFDGFPLVRQPRLSVMPVPPEIDSAIRELAGL